MYGTQRRQSPPCACFLFCLLIGISGAEAQREEVVASVRANEVPVEYVLFDDEGHGFRKRENRITASEAYLRFLERYLRGAPGAE